MNAQGAASCRCATRPVLAHAAGPLQPCATDSGGPSVPEGGRVPQEQEAAPFALLAGYAFAKLAVLYAPNSLGKADQPRDRGPPIESGCAEGDDCGNEACHEEFFPGPQPGEAPAAGALLRIALGETRQLDRD